MCEEEACEGCFLAYAKSMTTQVSERRSEIQFNTPWGTQDAVLLGKLL